MTVLLTHAELLVSSATPEHERLNNDYIPNEIAAFDFDLTALRTSASSSAMTAHIEYAEIFEQFRQDLDDDYSIESDFSDDDTSRDAFLFDDDDEDSITDEQAELLGINSSYGFGENDSVQLISRRRRWRRSASVAAARRVEYDQDGKDDGDVNVDIARYQQHLFEEVEEEEFLCYEETFVALKA